MVDENIHLVRDGGKLVFDVATSPKILRKQCTLFMQHFLVADDKACRLPECQTSKIPAYMSLK